MTTHEDISEQLSAYLDGELSAQDAQRVESAVASDAALAAELEQLRKTRQLLQSLPRQSAGEDFAAKVMQAALQQGALAGGQTWKPATLPGAWRRYLAAAALIVFAVGLGIFVSISMYDVSPQPIGQSELAIKTPDETRDVETLGRVARRLDDLQDGGAKKAEDSATETEERAELAPMSEREPADGWQAEMDKIAAKPAAMPPGMLAPGAASPPGAIPPPAAPAPEAEEPAEEYAFAKAAPTRGKAGAIVSKSGAKASKGSLAADESVNESLALKDDATPKNAPVYASKVAEEPEQPTSNFTGPQPISTLASNVAPADNEVIYTDNLAVSQKQVEAVLLANSVEITPLNQRTLQPSQANIVPSPAGKLRMKSAGTAITRQVQYVVYGSQDQLQQVRTQLDNEVRARQNVSQKAAVINGKSISGRLASIRAIPVQVEEKQVAQAEDAKNKARFEITQATPPAASQPESVASIEQPTSQQSQQAEAERIALQPTQSPQAQNQIRRTLLQNQAMLITLEFRPAADK